MIMTKFGIGYDALKNRGILNDEQQNLYKIPILYFSIDYAPCSDASRICTLVGEFAK